MATEDMPPEDMPKKIPVLNDIIKDDEDELVQDYPHLFSNLENESAAEGTTSEELKTEEATVSDEIDDEIIPALIDESDTAELSYTDTIETLAHETNSDLNIDLNDTSSIESEDLVTPVASAVS